MNYPYAMTWFGLAGGLRGLTNFKPHCPMLYLYGQRKPFMFHSEQWLDRLNAAPGSLALGLAGLDLRYPALVAVLDLLGRRISILTCREALNVALRLGLVPALTGWSHRTTVHG